MRNGCAAPRTATAKPSPPSTSTLKDLESHLAGRTRLTATEVEIGGKTYRVTHPDQADALINEEEFDNDERLPYWADLWPSAKALARWLSKEDLQGKRVLELGCGLGLPAVVCVSGGAEVVVSDQYEAALDFAVFNARDNDGREPKTFMFDWRRPEMDGLGTFDLVLGADILYEALSGLSLAELVPRLLAPGGEAVLADPVRNTAAVFLDGMEERGFRVETESAFVEQAGKMVEVRVHRLRN